MISGNEWIWVVIVLLVVFGGSQLPKIARNLGKAQRELKDAMAEGLEGDDSAKDADAS
ncbi:MAG: twin-arginine translocase TatA/TatE family subunit [Ilumatobacter coccineus]|uniref:Twin-arginine translocase TatA/TatE family subunit n=1 Tax=Ilumatobacter coccineus TaxID=467094 RepID=A0A2G6KFH0_9ACTN|nr:MAG: twin-arginine translocase TatA/TatE family subunit [Ilumatobacter coccineus]